MKLFMSVWLCAISILDIRSSRVPVWMLAAGGSAAGLSLVLQCGSNVREYMDVLKALLPGLLLLTVAFATKKAGYGDGIVMLCVGMILESGQSLLLFGLSLFLISIWSIGLIVFRKAGRDAGIPYLPFLTGAWFLIMTMW